MAADYYAILKNAIGALPETSGEARRAVYEKARRAVVEQLKAFDPPLSATEITQERLRLEDCIRRVEAEAAKGILTQTLSRTATVSAPPPPVREPETRYNRPVQEPATRLAPTGFPDRSDRSGDYGAERLPERPTERPTERATERYAERTYERPPERPTERQTERPTERPGDRMQERPTERLGERLPERPPERAYDRGYDRPSDRAAPPGSPPEPETGWDRGDRVTGERSRTAPTGGGYRPPAYGDTAAYGAPPAGAPYDTGPTTGPTIGPTTGPTAGREALRRAAEAADQMGAVVAETAQQARNTLLAGAGADAYARPEPLPDAAAEPAAERDAEAPFGERRRSRKPLIIGVAAGVVVLGIGAGALWTQQERIAAYLGDQKPFGINAGRVAGTAPPPKSTDRLNSDEPAASRPDVKTVQSQPFTVSPQGAAAVPLPVSPAAPAAPPAAAPLAATGTPTLPPVAAPAAPPAGLAAAPPAQQPVPMVAQRVSMMEENPIAGSQPLFSTGKVVWQLVRENQSGKPPVSVLRARVEIPDRRITMTLSMQPNSDPTFSASHLVEVRFSVPPDFDGKGIANVPGLIMKTTEQATGSPLIGASAKISNGFFWFALASGESDRQRNIALLKESGWMAVPVVYESGKRGLITLEKAGAGDRALTDALASWQ